MENKAESQRCNKQMMRKCIKSKDTLKNLRSQFSMFPHCCLALLWTWRGEERLRCMERVTETYITIWKIDSQREFAVWLRKLKQGLCINLEGWGGEGGSKGRGHMYTYG